MLNAVSFFHLAGSWQVGEELSPSHDTFISLSKNVDNPQLLHRNGLSLKYGFVDLDHVTHCLAFSVKINTNQLNGHFSKKFPYLEKEVSRFVLEVV